MQSSERKQTIKNLSDINRVLSRVDTPETLMAAPFTVGDGYYLQVAAGGWKGRKWYVSPHVSDSELIQIALLACLAHAEHEIRERFRYSPYSDQEPRAIYGPHFHADALWG